MKLADRLCLDIEQAQRHLSALGTPNTKFIFALIPEALGALGGIRHHYGTLAEVSNELEAAQRAGRGVYVAVNDFIGRRRIKAELKRWRAVWRELDKPSDRRLPLMPTLRIRSSPGKGHEYLLIDHGDPLANDEAEAINRVLVDRYDGDANARDASRVLRLAGSWHLKGEPSRVEIVGGSGEAYGRSALLTAFPIPVLEPRKIVQPQRVEHADRYIAATIEKLLDELANAPNGQRNATLNRASFRLGQLGIDVDEATTVLIRTALDVGLDDDEILRTIVSGGTAGLANPRNAARAA